MLVLGIDPGTSGAFAVYDPATRSLVGEVVDVPIWYQVVGKKRRPRVDALAIADMFDTYELMGVALVCMEAVGGRARQSAAHAFTFGYGVGIIYMAAFYSGIPIETIPPTTWKPALQVPGKARADDSAILARADELFPDDRHQFRGPKGGKLIDRAEAAMIAKFGGDIVLRTKDVRAVTDIRAVYKGADTGA